MTHVMASIKPASRRIAILVRLRFASGRDILYGVQRYASRHFNWQLHIINNFDGNTVLELHKLINEGLDGLIVNGIVFPEIGRLIGSLSIPTVVFGGRTPEMGRRTKALAFVRADSQAVGALAARYINGLGTFHAYGYVPTNQPSYASDLRQQGFVRELNRIGKTVAVFPPVHERTDGSVDEINAIGKWLLSLPKPAAILAAFDQRALHTIQAATHVGLKVPRDFSILGVDNDVLLCEFAKPPLTSVQIDHARLGEITARELERIITTTGCTRVRTVKTQETQIIERESAKPVAPSIKLVERALDYIDRNALKGIKASDVSAHLRVSRSLLDLRFRESTNTSVNRAILDRKFAEVKRLLSETSTPISKITQSCGFKSTNTAKNLFKTRFGCSMSEWRTRS